MTANELQEEALFKRMLMEVGLVDAAEIARWADELIAAGRAEPHLIEVSLSAAESADACAAALTRLAGNSFDSEALPKVFRVAHGVVLREPGRAPRVLSDLFDHLLRHGASSVWDEYADLSYLHEDVWGRQDSTGTITAEDRQKFAGILERYSARA